MQIDSITATVNLIIGIVFAACYAYQYVYILVSYLKKPTPHKPAKEHRFAVLVAARNEQTVIANLIRNIREQDYPSELVDIFVVADNCTDETAAVAKDAGATVFERQNPDEIGKGFALDFLLTRIGETVGTDRYDGFFVFDADNILESDYITEMNKTFSDGYRAVTSYRNTKNYGDNWISAGYGLWFLRESRLLNYPRHLVKSSCAISGTGFLFARSLLDQLGGWHFFAMTEDLEFTAYNILRGERIGFCREAVLYDEQPVKFGQSWSQRLRWSCGSVQVLKRHGKKLLRGCFTPGIAFPCFDFTFNMYPAYILSVLAVFANAGLLIAGFIAGKTLPQMIGSFLFMLLCAYGCFFLFGLLITISEWKLIRTKPWKKILYMFTFPLFSFTFVPIAVQALFAKPQWKPIEHNRDLSLDDIKKK